MDNATWFLILWSSVNLFFLSSYWFSKRISHEKKIAITNIQSFAWILLFKSGNTRPWSSYLFLNIDHKRFSKAYLLISWLYFTGKILSSLKYSKKLANGSKIIVEIQINNVIYLESLDFL